MHRSQLVNVCDPRGWLQRGMEQGAPRGCPESSAWEIVYMEMPYRGGTPKDIEENVLIPVERALEGISGIREVNSDGMPGMAKFYFKAKEGVDLDKLLDEIKSRIDTISTFPGETERAKIIIPDSSGRLPVLSVAVTGEFDEAALLQVTKKVQREILELEGVSRADIQGVRKTEISIEQILLSCVPTSSPSVSLLMPSAVHRLI